MSTQAIQFLHGDEPITAGIELRNGRASIGGWSSYEVWHVRDEPSPGVVDELKIADLYCGEPINLADGYGFTVTPMISVEGA